MFHRKLLLVVAVVVLCLSGVVYAGGLTAQEAMNYFNEGVKAQMAEDYNAAKTAYQKCILVAPSDLKWKKFIANNFGIIYLKQGELGKAEENFKEALALDPDYKPAQLNLGMIYEKRKTRLEALEYWAKVFHIEQMKPKSYLMEGAQLPEPLEKK